MTGKIARHSVHDLGNSYGVTLPKQWVRDNNVQPKDKLDIYREGETLIIKVPKK